MPTSAGFLVEIDGSPLPPEVAAQLASAYVDDSLRLPDLFVLRFRDQDRTVLSGAKVKIGSKAKISIQTADGQTPEPLISGEITALEAEFDSTGTFTVIRGYDQAHRLFRGRCTESYTQSTVSDVVTQVARRAGLKVGTVESTIDGASAPVARRGNRLGVPGSARPGDRLRGHRAERCAGLPQAGDRPIGAQCRRTGPEQPAGAQDGRRSAPVPLGGHLRRAGQGGPGARLGPGREEGADRQCPGRDQDGGVAHHGSGGDRQDLRRSGVRGQRYGLSLPGRGRRGRERSGRTHRRRLRRVRGGGAGQPETSRQCADLDRGHRRAVRGQVHHHHLPAPLRPGHRVHDCVRGDRAAGTQPVRAHVGPVDRGRPVRRARSSAWSAMSRTRRTRAGSR